MGRPLLTLIFATGGCLTPAFAQAVLSAHAGLVTYSEAPILVDQKSTEISSDYGFQLGVDQIMTSGNTPAELELGHGAMLRIAPYSTLSLKSDQLVHPEIKLQHGVFLLEVFDLTDGVEITIHTDGSTTTIAHQGLYRFQLLNQLLLVYDGEAVTSGNKGRMKLKQGEMGPLSDARGEFHGKSQFDTKLSDEFHVWSSERSFLLYQDDLAFSLDQGGEYPDGIWDVTDRDSLYSEAYQAEFPSAIVSKYLAVKRWRNAQRKQSHQPMDYSVADQETRRIIRLEQQQKRAQAY